MPLLRPSSEISLDSPALEAARISPETNRRGSERLAAQTILLSAGLGGIKLATGLLGNSYALLADAAESLADVCTSAITLRGLQVAAEPPDSLHPAGHGRAETIAGALTAIVLAGVGGLIFYQALLTLGQPRVGPNPLALLIVAPVILLKEWMFQRLSLRGRRTGSTALMTEAWHQRSDAVTSGAALIGILISWIGGPAFSHADSWAALLASLWLIGTAVWLIGPALHELMEGSVDPALYAFIQRTSRTVGGICGVDKIWVRKLGTRLQIDLHIEVDPEISVQEGHRLAHEVKSLLQSELPQVRDVMVHVEPFTAPKKVGEAAP